jgi:hypothetical protein
MRSIYYLVIVAWIFTSCSSVPSVNSVQTAIAETQFAQPTDTSTPIPTATPIPSATPTPVPTGTSTPIPLSAIDFDSILTQPGIFPSEYQIYHYLPPMCDECPRPIKHEYQTLEQDNDWVGSILLLVYDSENLSTDAYNIILDGMVDADPVENLGERAQINTIDYLSEYSISWVDLLFKRCNVVVHIRMDVLDQDIVISYAHKLDERLTPLVCR